MAKRNRREGFTLIELSIVLVIIGLLVGGVLVGQDLIRAAAVRAQISQIERFNTAANTFLGKYGYLPGDIKEPEATSFGFAWRGTSPGQGDGNGIIDGTDGSATCGYCVASGEQIAFWTDLSLVRMVDGSFTIADAVNGTGTTSVTGTSIRQFLPAAKMGDGNYIYVWSGGSTLDYEDAGSNGLNYFGISAVQELYYYYANTSPSLTVQQAYNIDKKTDDGYPNPAGFSRFTSVTVPRTSNPSGRAARRVRLLRRRFPAPPRLASTMAAGDEGQCLFSKGCRLA